MESLAPPVVVVVVTHDPGPWFETTLRAIRDQDYPETSVLVLDAASVEDPTMRVAEILPEAFVRRLATNEGFGACANVATSMVEGADFLVVCHDDVAPRSDALRSMVEEAYRSNAGVVGPKFVEWDRPERILHVGAGVDKTGAVVDRVDRGEVDHGQHDRVRDVFSTPGGFTLIRRDLFEELGGFDPHIVLMGEDLDLCWRAQVAGARVIVAPQAVVRHLELLASGARQAACTLEPGGGSEGGRQVSIQELQRRGELHAALKAYGPWQRLRVVPQMVALAVIEMIVLLFTGRGQRARDVAASWRWNFALRGAIRRERRALDAIRRIPDSQVRLLQVGGSVRARRYARGLMTQGLRAARLGGNIDRSTQAPVFADRSVTGDERGASRGTRRRTSRLLAWTLLCLALLFGVRLLLTGGFPVLGELLRVPSPDSLFSQYAGGTTVFGSHTALAATPATIVMAVAGYVLFGSTGLLQTILVLGCLPAGALGVARIARRFAHPWAPFVAAACYLSVPLPYDDIATGHLEALFAYAAAPWVLLSLAKAAALGPFVTSDGTRAAGEAPELEATTARFLRRILALGTGIAFLVAFDPPGAFVTVVTGVTFALGILLVPTAGSWRAATRVLVTTLGALATAVVLLAPWSISVLSGASPLDLLGGTKGGPATGATWSSLVRLSVGPIGGTPLVWGLIAAAALPLLIGRRWRLEWSGRILVCASTAWIVALAAERGWLGSLSVLPAQLLPVAAVGVACSISLGVAAFRLDLPSSRFGWRQAVSVLAGCAAVIGALPVVAALGGGRFDLPTTGYSQVLSWLPNGSNTGTSGVLWLGDADSIPGRGWPLATGLEYSVTAGGIPDMTSIWRGPPSASDVRAASAVVEATAGRTVVLGRLLADDSIRYVVVASALAPDVPGLQQPQVDLPPPALVAALDNQADLNELPSQGGYTVYSNPEYVAKPQGPVTPPSANGLAVAGEVVLWVILGGALILWRRRAGVSHGELSRTADPDQQTGFEEAVSDTEPQVAGPVRGDRRHASHRAKRADRTESLVRAPGGGSA